MNQSLFRNRYRIPSTRLPGWDYSASGLYFVTLCVKDRRPCLAEVVNGEVCLSAIGEIVAEEWVRTAQIRPYVMLDAWVIMPNHLHGIIGITAPDDAMVVVVETPRRGVYTTPTPHQGVSTTPTPFQDAFAIPTPRRDGPVTPTPFQDASTTPTPRRDGPVTPTPCADVSTAATTAAKTAAASAAWKSQSLGAIIGQFKSVCTKRIWAAGYRDFAWQPRFYDRIVRNEGELERIRAYILANPSRWEHDRENAEALEM